MALEGQQLGRYRLLQLLGTGGMGEVYLATDTLINRQVAIKVIRSEVSAYPDAGVAQESARLFQREMKAIAMLDHPHIMPLFDYGETTINGASLAYLVMPYRQEGSLATWLKQRSTTNLLSPQDVSNFVSQAADALQNAHDHAIIHQDVKSANFLIRRVQGDPNHPELLLADFGVSKFSSATANASQSIRGTPTSMAPEQWEGTPVPATDQYALAVMAYELLTGRPPFQGGLSQLMYQHFNVAAPPPSSFNPRLPADVDTVLLHALAKKPTERFASIAAFARAFQQAVSTTQAASGKLPSRTYEAAPGSIPTPPPSVPLQQPPQQQQASSEIQAVLAISSAEASSGTTRTLTLPDGRQIIVRVPPGAYDGQRISVQESGGPGGPPMTLTLALAVLQTNARSMPDNTERTMRASNPDIVAPKNPSVTPFLGQTPIPPPPPGFEQSWAPVPNPPSQPPVPNPASWAPVPNLETQAPTIPPSNPNLQQQQTMRAFSSTAAPAAPPSPSITPRRRRKWRNALLAALALLLVLGGLGIFTLVHNAQVATDKANATATAQAKVRANASATSLSNNTTATAEANAIATQAAINDAQATATVAAYQNLYNASTRGAPALNDPLSDNSRGNGWGEGVSAGSGCQFTGGAYHATTPNSNFFESCGAFSTNFANFAYSVQMKIVQGSCGGMLFRADVTNSKFYYWRVCQDGTYSLLRYVSNSGSTSKILIPLTNASFNTGLNQSNLLTVIAKGHTFYFYINKQEVDSISDGTYNQGQIGLTAESFNSSPTDAAYTNAEVWTL
jgi:eukaryotic-like serine/threonine-protein kinase